ncbi:hypothetical protein L249_7465, partial [Ophiocordyceps polyrhachis-furcata BCC 54312]
PAMPAPAPAAPAVVPPAPTATKNLQTTTTIIINPVRQIYIPGARGAEDLPLDTDGPIQPYVTNPNVRGALTVYSL